MALMRGFSKVDAEGKIAIPSNIRREVKLEKGQLVEVKVQGPALAQFITIKPRQTGR